MTTTLEDIRVGDIMLTPIGEERKVEQCSGDMVHAGDDIWYRRLSLRNPEFRVGDRIRGRNPAANGRWRWTQEDINSFTPPDDFALVERAPVVEKKPDGVRVMENRAGPWKMNHEGSHVRDDGTAMYRAIVSRVGDRWEGIASGAVRVLMLCRDDAMAWCDARLRDEGWVLEDQPEADPRCTLCGHARPRHYASCEHNPEPKGTLISTLGWPQPAPIVVLCQNEEDVP